MSCSGTIRRPAVERNPDQGDINLIRPRDGQPHEGRGPGKARDNAGTGRLKIRGAHRLPSSPLPRLALAVCSAMADAERNRPGCCDGQASRIIDPTGSKKQRRFRPFADRSRPHCRHAVHDLRATEAERLLRRFMNKFVAVSPASGPAIAVTKARFYLPAGQQPGGAWGSRNPRYLILGVTKGDKQSQAMGRVLRGECWIPASLSPPVRF